MIMNILRAEMLFGTSRDICFPLLYRACQHPTHRCRRPRVFTAVPRGYRSFAPRSFGRFRLPPPFLPIFATTLPVCTRNLPSSSGRSFPTPRPTSFSHCLVWTTWSPCHVRDFSHGTAGGREETLLEFQRRRRGAAGSLAKQRWIWTLRDRTRMK